MALFSCPAVITNCKYIQ